MQELLDEMHRYYYVVQPVDTDNAVKLLGMMSDLLQYAHYNGIPVRTAAMTKRDNEPREQVQSPVPLT